MTADSSASGSEFVTSEGASGRYSISEESLLAQFFLLGTKGSRTYFYPALVGVGAIVFASMFVADAYTMQLLYIWFMYVALGSVWNFFSGYSGYILFGVTIFFGIGGYATAAFMKAFSFQWPVAVLCAVVLTGAVAAGLGFILLRISGIYFGIGTFLILEGLRQGIYFENQITGFLGGSSGITMAPMTAEASYLAFGSLALVSIALTYELSTSKFGLRLMSIREDEAALRSLGVNPLHYKLTALVIAAAIMAVLGSLYGLSLGFLYPETPFNQKILSTIILGAVLGGRGTVVGPILGILILVSIEEVLWLNFPNLYLVMYGLSLVLVVLLLPEGIINRLKKSGVLPDSRGV